MAIVCEFKDIRAWNVEEAAKVIATEVAPLYLEYWKKHGEKTYGKPLDLNVPLLMQLWQSRHLALVVAKEDGIPVGFLLGMKFRPYSYESIVLQIEKWEARDNPACEKALFEELNKALPFMGVDEVWIQDTIQGTSYLDWKAEHTFTCTRYKRG
jgi:hypothetical protein